MLLFSNAFANYLVIIYHFFFFDENIKKKAHFKLASYAVLNISGGKESSCGFSIN